MIVLTDEVYPYRLYQRGWVCNGMVSASGRSKGGQVMNADVFWLTAILVLIVAMVVQIILDKKKSGSK